ncbi:family 43 glycosylhydrolase [Herbinix luporum]|uniref:family 43 glycosylhydrolase n=1 Tax=Herbinix luporum TaxID=1679721 RepID=UPI0023F32920|nr:family 43 glycosylhydrolase [Herbinix luporum]
MDYICNPINMEYKYQFIDQKGKLSLSREAADPSIILFKEKYYLFPSMTKGFLVSHNLTEWEFHPLKNVPVYDYAPDVRVIGDYIYFSASKWDANCSFYRSTDPINKGFEEIPGTFPFWDPNLFVDDDGKIYFYWGCSDVTPIYGVELNPQDMTPMTEPVELIFSNIHKYGFERRGEDHKALNSEGESTAPYIEGPWMDKYKGKYYLQYAFPGTEFNIYGDGVYISDSPLGPFKLAKNNPFSYKPGGFIPGAGHGSTLKDKKGNWWHLATMRISVNHPFERRLGIWPAGFDKEGELFCNQRYGDWPMKVENLMEPWKKPDWMLLSYNKPCRASSYVEGREPKFATDENVQTWWRAAGNKSGQWIEIDLLDCLDVRAIQINFADEIDEPKLPEGKSLIGDMPRYIDEKKYYTRWILEASIDGEEYFVIEDKSKAETDLAHDFIVREEGLKARYIKCTIMEVPYNQNPCISGLRIFGLGKGPLPAKSDIITTEFISDLDLLVKWKDVKATGYNVLWGYAQDKLYHSYMVFGKNKLTIGALIKDQAIFVRVDAFNEVWITEGDVIKVK